jgi:hypothetical protein
MDRAQLCRQHLAGAERHVATARRNVARQRALVAALARSGRSIEKAVSLLDLYEQVLDLHLQDRERLRAELFALCQPASHRFGSGWPRDTQR